MLFVNPASDGGKAARAALADRARERGIGVAVVGPDGAVEVHGRAPVHAGIDGDAGDFSAPLDIEILPAALRVRISARHPACPRRAGFRDG